MRTLIQGGWVVGFDGQIGQQSPHFVVVEPCDGTRIQGDLQRAEQRQRQVCHGAS